jgi:hypothetical protein
MEVIHRAPFILGAALLVAAMLWALYQWNFRNSALQADGLVVDVAVETDVKSNRLFHPVVEFTDYKGELVRFKEGVGITGSPLFDKGERVAVLYVQANTSQAQIDTFSSNWLGPLLTAGFGLLFMGVAFVIPG